MGHFFSSSHPDVLNISASILADFYAIIKWVNKHHPEYVFLMSSDHGSAEFIGGDEIEMHGPVD